jgi:hypothetical protein
LYAINAISRASSFGSMPVFPSIAHKGFHDDVI